MVQGAVYDAVNAIAGPPYQPYLRAPRTHRGDNASAYRVLLSLLPGQSASLDSMYATSLATIPDGRGKTGGIAVGACTSGPPTWTG
jgi:hypothetical protein